MAVTSAQSHEYLKKFDKFLVDSSNFIQIAEVGVENFLKNWLHSIGYNSIITDYFVEEIISASGVVVLIVLFIILYLILRRRH
jgi:hypothetical protein